MCVIGDFFLWLCDNHTELTLCDYILRRKKTRAQQASNHVEKIIDVQFELESGKVLKTEKVRMNHASWNFWPQKNPTIFRFLLQKQKR